MTRREAYIELHKDELQVSRREILSAMQRHEKDWWESNDEKEVVREQLQEDILLVPLGRWLSLLSKVLKKAITIADYLDQEKYQMFLKDAYEEVNKGA